MFKVWFNVAKVRKVRNSLLVAWYGANWRLGDYFRLFLTILDYFRLFKSPGLPTYDRIYQGGRREKSPTRFDIWPGRA